MAINVTSPLTGATVPGLTSPTYTLVDDISPAGAAARQKVVTALGGTQAGVLTHTISSPFIVLAQRPSTYKLLGRPHPVTGLINDVPVNTTRVVVKKGVTPAANQPSKICTVDVSVHCPAGAETYDYQNVSAAISAAIGAAWQQSAGLATTVNIGTL